MAIRGRISKLLREKIMLLRFKYYIRVVLSLIVIVSLQSSLLAAPREVVKWSELGAHLAEKSVVIESMPVIDCPVGIDSESAEHLVCQVIENTFYKWKEYEFFTAAGETRLAIEMIKPEPGLLTAVEAQVLLNGSKLWERQPLESLTGLVACPCPIDHPKTKNQVYRTPQIYQETTSLEVSVSSVDDTTVNVVPRSAGAMEVDDEPVIRESIHHTDDRLRVTNTASYPWNTICYISLDVNGESYRGSGTLISPSCVLTCGHNVWEHDLSVWSRDVKVTAGQYQYYEWGPIYKPFGTVSYSSVDTSSGYINGSGTGEYDYGVVKLRESFTGISTFIPLVYDVSPTVVHVAGYPGTVKDESNSYSMWYDYDHVIDYEGVDDRIMVHMADTSGGQSGSPVWTYDSNTENYRLVAIHIFGAIRGNGACRLVSANESTISEWMMDSVSYTYSAYIPYFSKNSAVGRWTGLAFTNRNPAGNSLKVDYYSNAGSPLGSETKTVAANGQTSFVPDTTDGVEGWIKISSTASLNGLALIAESTPSTMFDIDLKDSLHQTILIPHLAVSDGWNSIAMICNPNSTVAGITYKYYNGDGVLTDQKPSTIPANGSVQQDLYTLFQRELEGSMVIESSRPVTAFFLYDNSLTTWKAGLSAVPLD